MINKYLAICVASLRYGVHRSLYAPSSLIRLIDSVISPYLILPSVPTAIPTIHVTILRTTIIGHNGLLIRHLLPPSSKDFLQSVLASANTFACIVLIIGSLCTRFLLSSLAMSLIAPFGMLNPLSIRIVSV